MTDEMDQVVTEAIRNEVIVTLDGHDIATPMDSLNVNMDFLY